MKKVNLIISATIIVAAVGFLGYKGFMASATYYYTVSEFRAQQSTLSDKNVRVSGMVADGTIEKQGRVLKFTLTEGQQALPVIYQGMVPDSFKADGEAVVQGKLNTEGVFEASTLLAKCPSKYEPASDQSSLANK